MMTFAAGEGAVAAKRPGPGEDRNGAYYVKLRNDELEESSGDCIRGDGSTSSQAAEAVVAVGCEVGGRWWSFWWWAKLLLLLVFLGVLAAVFLIWVGPFFMDKEIIPILNWEMKTFSAPVLAVFVFGSVALFPTFLLPSTPSMWVAGMTFGYGYGFLLIIGGAAIGVSLPYFIGYLFRRRVQVFIERYPKNASMIRLAGEGDCLNQFQAVALIRISPFPYIVYNYCAMATGVKYFPYLLGSLVGMVPEIFVAIYTGILIKTLANASHDQHSLSAPQIICTVFGFCLTVATTVLITVYAKRRLKQLQADDELLLQ